METLTEEEIYEARSMRYVDAARVVRLTSGKFVVFSMTQGDIVGTAQEPEVNSQLGDAIVEAIARSARFWAEARERELQRKAPLAEVFVEKSAKELGL